MVRQLTPQSTLEHLKREAKRWLHALSDNNPDVQREARARLDGGTPNAPQQASLRHVQHALAREHGFDGWAALKTQLAANASRAAEHADRVASFIENACPDHNVRGAPAHVRAYHTARRLLERYPELARILSAIIVLSLATMTAQEIPRRYAPRDDRMRQRRIGSSFPYVSDRHSHSSGPYAKRRSQSGEITS
jgi:hypothetical protein